MQEVMEQSRENEKEFGCDELFLCDVCTLCGDGKRKTHREIMRERGLSGKHDLCQQFIWETHFRLLSEERKRKERRKFWKRWLYRPLTPEERSERAAPGLVIARMLFPGDWQKMAERSRTKAPDSDEWMDMSVRELVNLRLKDLHKNFFSNTNGP
jgi:hypothetical protein